MTNTNSTKIWDDPKFLIIMCLTLGLAPFVPEPHIWGKVRWIMGGAKGMQAMDYFDFVMHGTPWFLLIRYGVMIVFQKLRKKPTVGQEQV
ncbi:MAG TPA: hypothetical protein PKA12_03285 [Saprospiraceae bacterium]|nr:hypothetical protein [Saprospiraceae bacterium]